MKLNFNSIVDTARELHAHADNEMYLKIVSKLKSEIFDHPEKETVEFTIPARFNLLIDLNMACEDLDVEHRTSKKNDNEIDVVIEYTKKFSRNKIWDDAELLDWHQDEIEEDNTVKEKKKCNKDKKDDKLSSDGLGILVDGDDITIDSLK